MFSTFSVAMGPFSISERPPPLPRAIATTLGRPGAASSSSTSRPASRIQSATNAATSRSPAPPGTRSGFTESIDTSVATSSSGVKELGHDAQVAEWPSAQLAHDRVHEPLLVTHLAIGHGVDQAALALEQLRHAL